MRIVLFAALPLLASAWSLSRSAMSMRTPGFGLDRRALLQSAVVVVPLVLGGGKKANAVPAADEERLRKGYKQLCYLLENWDQETTKCNNAGGCIRTPDNIRFYLGMRSTKDPLFQIDKLLLRVGSDIEGDDGERYENALNEWTRHVEQANIMAYTSSWGEANPGGGQGQINRFAQKALDEVVAARLALKTMVDVLAISI